MKRTYGLWLAGVMAAVLLTGCKTQPSAPGACCQPVTMVRHLSANDPSFTQGDVVVITTQAQLDKSGSKELSKLGLDFNQQSLVVLSLGQKPSSGYWARITGVQRCGSKLCVQGIANQPDKAAAATKTVTHPIDAVVVPRLDEVTHINSEIDSVTGQAPPTEAPATPPAK